MPPNQFPNRFLSSLLRCPNCRAPGALTWEKGVQDVDDYSILVRVSGAFHIETGRISADSKMLVCTKCDEIYGPLPATGNVPSGA